RLSLRPSKESKRNYLVGIRANRTFKTCRLIAIRGDLFLRAIRARLRYLHPGTQDTACFSRRAHHMSDARKQIFNLAALPDWAVRTDQQTSGVLGLSLDTLRRLDRGRDGPPRVELSPRRHGRPVGELRKWIQQRVGASLHGPQIQADVGRIVAGANHTSC